MVRIALLLLAWDIPAPDYPAEFESTEEAAAPYETTEAAEAEYVPTATAAQLGPTWDLGAGLAAQGPTCLVLAIGVLVALANWRRAPGAAGLALVAMIVQGLAALLTPALTYFVPKIAGNIGPSTETLLLTYQGVSCFGSVGSALAWLLMLVAVFKGRGAAPSV
jgi:hypothetical protein